MKAIAEPAKAPEAKPKAPESKSASKPDPKDDLKSLPMPEVEKDWDPPRKG